MTLPVVQLLTGSGCREGPPTPGSSEEPSQHPGSLAMSAEQTNTSQHLFISITVRRHFKGGADFANLFYPHLDLISEALSNIESLVWIPQYDFEAFLQTQLPPNSGQPSVGPCCQSQRGDPQQDHVTVVGGTLLGSIKQ